MVFCVCGCEVGVGGRGGDGADGNEGEVVVGFLVGGEDVAEFGGEVGEEWGEGEEGGAD